jgi:hypothetical protein
MENIIKGVVIIKGLLVANIEVKNVSINKLIFDGTKNKSFVKLQPWRMILILLQIYVSHIMKMVKNNIFYIPEESKLEVLLFLV